MPRFGSYNLTAKFEVKLSYNITTMKYLLSLVALFVLSENARAYQPMLQSNQTWEVTIYGLIAQNVSHTLGNATVINGQEYTPVISNNSTFPGEPFTVALLREDVAEEKIYIYEDGQEYLLYDFGVEVGETITIRSVNSSVDITITNVSEIEINGVSRKIISYAQGEWFVGDYTEGIGSRYGLIDFATAQITDYSPWLTCYYENGELIWDNTLDKLSCNSVSNIEESEILELAVFPNPTAEELFINFSDNVSGQILFQVFDTAGKLVLEKKENVTSVIRLDVSTLSTGNYTVKATSEQVSIKPISFLKK
jgi:hypothetical protein